MGSNAKRDAFGNMKKGNKTIGFLLIGLISVLMIAIVLCAIFVWPGLNSTPDGGADDDFVTKRNGLNDYTWNEIQAIANSDVDLADYNIRIGDTKVMLETTYILVDDARDNHYGGLIFMFDSGASERMDDSATNAGGYSDAQLKLTVDAMYNDLPSVIKNVIKTVQIGSNCGAENNKHVNYEDVNLFLPSVREVGFSVTTEPWYGQSLEQVLDQECIGNDEYEYDKAVFDWFAGEDANANRAAMCSSGWWLRSAMGMLDMAFWFIDENGNLGIVGVAGSYNVAQAFVVG